MARTLPATALLLVITLALGSATAEAQVPPVEAISLDFPGGTAIEYVEAVRRAAGDLNVIVRPEVRLVRIEKVQLRQVDPESALLMLHGLEQRFDDRIVRLDLESFHSGMDGARELYAVGAEVQPLRTPRPDESRVWATTDLTRSGISAEDMLTAVETSLDLLGDAFPAVRMRYHRETGLLIVRGHAEQLATIGGVLDELHASRPPDTDAREEFRRMEMEAMERIGTLEQRLHATTAEMQQAVREVTVFQTRAELFEREIDALRERLETTTREHRVAITERDAMIAQLRHRLLDATGQDPR